MALGVIGFFFLLFWPVVERALPETDLWWMIPSIARHVEGKNRLALFSYLVSPGPLVFDQPSLKILLWGMLDFFRFPYRSLLIAAFFLHFLNGIGVYLVGRSLAMRRFSAAGAALTYLAFFGQFHAYWWPPATQHMLAVSTILFLFYFYRKSEEGTMAEQKGRFFWRAGAWLTGLLGIFQRSTLIAPVLILADLWMRPGSARERESRYRRWAPLLAIYPLYFLIALCWVGDLGTNLTIFQWALPAPAKLLLLEAVILLGVFAIGKAMRLQDRIRQSPRFGWGLAALMVLVVWGALFLRDRREILFPYNALSPALMVLGSFLDPLRTAMEINNVDGYYRVPSQVSLIHLAAVIALFAFFIRSSLRSHPARLSFLFWYVCALFYLLLHRHVKTSFPLQIPSRYLVYLSPPMALMFWSLVERWGEGVLKKRGMTLAWGVLGALLLTANLVAVRCALFRGNWANTFYFYDDWRTAQLLKEAGVSARSVPVRLEGVVPTDFHPAFEKYVPIRRIRFDNLYFAWRETFGRDAPLILNEENPPGPAGSYRMEEERILDSDGRNVEPFSRLVEQGLSDLRAGKEEAAQRSFRGGIERRPHFLRTLIGKAPLAEIRWITNGEDLAEWLERVSRAHRKWSVAPIQKWERTVRVVDRELRDYVLCFYALAYLEDRHGSPETARRWLSQIRFLQRDADRVSGWFTGKGDLQGNEGLKTYLEQWRDPETFRDPLPWLKDDYGMGRFLLRFLMGIQIRSRWDRECGIEGV